MDWKLLIADLMEREWTQGQIASYCDCGQATISELAKGKTINPSFKLGQALISLHKSKRKAPALKAA